MSAQQDLRRQQMTAAAVKLAQGRVEFAFAALYEPGAVYLVEADRAGGVEAVPVPDGAPETMRAIYNAAAPVAATGRVVVRFNGEDLLAAQFPGAIEAGDPVAISLTLAPE